MRDPWMRDTPMSPDEWLREAKVRVEEEARMGHRWIETPRGWRLTGRPMR